MKSDFLIAITQLAAERKLPREVVLGAIEAALVSAFKKETPGVNQEISVRILPNTGDIKVYAHRLVVEDPEDLEREIGLEEARKIRADAQLGETVLIEATPQDAGRIAAQTAKQVVLQRLREAERDLIYEEYSTRIGELLTGVVQKLDGHQVIINLGRAEALLSPAEQVTWERYRPGQRLRVLLLDVQKGVKGPQIIVSRSHPDLLRRLFELEVPEVMNGTVVIRSISRDPGYRSKVAVEARQEGVDPVGSCVGLRGVRIQNIVNELQGERIDVIQWNKNPVIFLAHALNPAQVQSVKVIDERVAEVVVPDRQLSLAIGREGQNARLAAKLTGYRIDIKSVTEALAEEAERTARGPEQAAATVETEAPPAPAEEAPLAVAEESVPVAAEEFPVATEASEPVEAAAPAEVEKGTTPAQQPAAEAGPLSAEEEEAALEAALRALEEEEAAQRELEEAQEEEEEEEEPLRAGEFDFDTWLKQYQAQDAGQIRFAEDIFPERGRFRSRGRRGREDQGRTKSSRRGDRNAQAGLPSDEISDP